MRGERVFLLPHRRLVRFALHRGPDPEDSRSGGSWFVGDDEDDGGDGAVTETAYGVDEALPGVPTSGSFVPAPNGRRKPCERHGRRHDDFTR